MNLLLRSMLLLLVLLGGFGCEIDRVLTVKRDGSATIHERFLAARESYFGGTPAVAKDGGDSGPPTVNLTPGIEKPSAEAAAKRAADYGDGVKLVEYRQLDEKDMLGYDVTYEVPDVTKIRIDTFVQGPGASPDPAAATKDSLPHIEFTKGDVCELVVPLKGTRNNSLGKGKAPSSETKPDLDQTKKTIEAMKHFRFYTAIRVEGAIKETNAHFREGNEVVISEMNTKGYLADPKNQEMVKDFESGKKAPPSDAPEDSRYFKDETSDVLKIRFQ